MATSSHDSPPPLTVPRPAPEPPAPQPRDDGAAGSPPVPLPHHKIRRTRISGLWAAVACFAVVLLLLLIFIVQNSRTVEVSYLGAHGHLPLGAALLLAAVCGILLVALAGSARIIQLRRTARRHRQDDSQHATAGQAAPHPGQP